MVSLKRQFGYGSLLVMALVGVLAVGSTVYYKTRIQQSESARETYESSAEELRQISSALAAYYRDNRSWPATINDLAAGGYFSGDAARCGGNGTFQSPFCTSIFGAQSGDNYTLTVNLLKESIAETVANQIPGGSSVGTTVVATIPRPFQSALYEDYLQRIEDPGNPRRTQLEVDLDINNNDLINIGSLNIEKATFSNAEFTNTEIDRVNVKEIQLGGNSITFDDEELNVNAGAIRVNGTLSMNGDVTGSGNDITGIDAVLSSTGQFGSIHSDSAVIDNISGDSIEFTSGSIDSLNGTSLTFDNGTISTISGDALAFNSGAVNSISGNVLNFNIGNIGSLSGDSLLYSAGTVNQLGGTTLTYDVVNSASGSFDTISANNSTIGNMAVVGVAGTNRISSSNGNINSLDVTTGSINRGDANSVSGASLSNSGNSTFSNLDSDRIEVGNVKGVTVEASSGIVSGNASIGVGTASNLVINNELQTDVINSNASVVGNALASKVNVQGELSALGINVTTAKFNTGNILQVNGTDANLNRVIATQFNGGAFNSSGDFESSDSSVNKNYELITEQEALLTNCVDVTKFCVPQEPTVSVSCSTCNSSAERNTFSARVIGAIDSCRQGCSYDWVTSGAGLVFSNCGSGSVSEGGTATAYCDVVSNLEAQESASGSAKLIVTNNRYSSESNSSSASISFENITSGNIIQDEISLVCNDIDGDCRHSERLGSYKGTASGTIEISVNVSSKVLNPVFTANIISSNCFGEKEGSLSNYGRNPEVNILNNNRTVSLGTFAFVQSSGETARSECEADVEFTVTSSSTPGVGILRKFIYIEACAVYGGGGGLCGPGGFE